MAPCERELCQCDSNPEDIARDALERKVRQGRRLVKKFQSVWIMENKDA